MALIFPKYVALTNFKLNALYYLLLIIVGLGLALRFLNFTENSVIAVPQGQVIASVAEPSDLENSTLDICKNPGIYEYWWDSDGERRQGPHNCTVVCAPDVSGTQSAADLCVRPAETYMQETSDKLFLVTEFSEQYIDTEKAARHYFVPSADALSLAFEYSFSVFQNGPFNGGTTSGAETFFSSSKDILTVVATKDEHGEYEVSFILLPQNKVVLSVSQLMQLAGRSLDVIQPESGANMHPGATHPSGPLARMAGVELRVHMSCHKSIGATSLDIEHDWEGPVCIAEVNSMPVWWVAKHQVEVVGRNGSIRERRYHGVRVSFTVGGAYRFFNLNKLLLNIACCIVCMSLPRSFVMFFCVYCLGRLSRVYKQAIYQRCDLQEQGAGTVARLLSASATYEQLQRGPDTGADDATPVLSRRKLKRRLSLISKHQGEDLTDRELESLVDYCLQVLSGKHGAPTRANRLGVARTLATFSSTDLPGITAVVHDAKKKEKDKVISPGGFSAANTSIEQFSFSSFRELLDVNRVPARVEKLFMPRQIRAQRAAIVSPASKDAAKDSSRDSSPDRGGGDPRQRMGAASRTENSQQNRKRSVCCGCCGFGTSAVAYSNEAEDSDGEPKGQLTPSVEDELLSQTTAEPSPEPGFVKSGSGFLDSKGHSCEDLVRRLASLEDFMKSCDHRLTDTLKTMSLRMFKLESGLAVHTKEFGTTKKQIDMLEALTGASVSIPQPLATRAASTSVSIPPLYIGKSEKRASRLDPTEAGAPRRPTFSAPSRDQPHPRSAANRDQEVPSRGSSRLPSPASSRDQPRTQLSPRPEMPSFDSLTPPVLVLSPAAESVGGVEIENSAPNKPATSAGRIKRLPRKGQAASKMSAAGSQPEQLAVGSASIGRGANDRPSMAAGSLFDLGAATIEEDDETEPKPAAAGHRAAAQLGKERHKSSVKNRQPDEVQPHNSSHPAQDSF